MYPHKASVVVEVENGDSVGGSAEVAESNVRSVLATHEQRKTTRNKWLGVIGVVTLVLLVIMVVIIVLQVRKSSNNSTDDPAAGDDGSTSGLDGTNPPPDEDATQGTSPTTTGTLYHVNVSLLTRGPLYVGSPIQFGLSVNIRSGAAGGTLLLQYLGITSRGRFNKSDSTCDDNCNLCAQPFQQSLVVPLSSIYTLNASVTYSVAGSYDVFAAYQMNNTWYWADGSIGICDTNSMRVAGTTRRVTVLPAQTQTPNTTLPHGPAPIPADRVAEVRTFNGKAHASPQYFTDNVAMEFTNARVTPPMLGSFTHRSVAAGLWSNPNIWNPATMPGAGAIVQVSHNVIYDVESDAKLVQIKVEGSGGKLKWDTTKDTRIWVDTITSYGIIEMGTYWQPIPDSSTAAKPRAEVVFWQSAAPKNTTNLGMNAFGPVRINGATKADRLFLQNSVTAGATSIKLQSGTLASAGWKVGDTIVIGSSSDYERYDNDVEYKGPKVAYMPRQNGYMMTDSTVTYDEEQSLGFAKSFDEKRIITAINTATDTVTFTDGLQYKRDVITRTLPRGQTATMRPVVAHLTRSIRFRSENPSVRQARGHLMFAFNDNVQIRWVEVKDMGRTDVDPTMWLEDGEIGYADAARTQQISDIHNVRGRYPIHFHNQAKGPTFAARMTVLEGASVWGDDIVVPGRGIAHHASRMAIERCVVYNVRGSGMFSETGSEIGQWLNNTVLSIRGDGFGHNWGTRHEVWLGHNGHAGIAYENQGRAVLLQGNIASCANIAFLWHHQIAPFLPVYQDVINPLTEIFANDGFSLRLVNPLVWGNSQAQTKTTSTSQLTSWRGIFGGLFGGTLDTYGAAQAQIPDFMDNTAWSCKSGFVVTHRRAEDRQDSTPMIARRFHCWGSQRCFHLINYSHLYAFYDSLWGRNVKAPSTHGAAIGTVSWEFSFANIAIVNMAGGITDEGNLWNYNAFPQDITTNADVAISYGTVNGPLSGSPAGSKPSQHPMYGIFGPWSSADTWPSQPRIPKIYNSTTDFPSPYPLANTHVGSYGGPDAPGIKTGSKAKPYFWLDTANSQLTLKASDPPGTLAIPGAVVDKCGVRVFEDFQSPESDLNNMHSNPPPSNWHGTPQRMVERNSCYTKDGGATWYMRLWFVSYERMDGSYIFPSVDILLQGFNATFLAAHQVTDEMTTKPDLPLKPEALRTEDIDLVVERIAPTVITSPTQAIAEGEKLNLFLQADSGVVTWSVTGVDSSLFAINSLRYLQLKTGGSFDYTKPLDAGKVNLYHINLVATEPLQGTSTSLPITIRVSQKSPASGVTWWSDNLLRPSPLTSPLTFVDMSDSNLYWRRNPRGNPRTAGYIYTDGSGSFSVPDGEATFYTGAPLSSGNVYQTSTTCNRDGGYFNIYFGLEANNGVIHLEVFNAANSWGVRRVDMTSVIQPNTTLLFMASETYYYGHTMRLNYTRSTGVVALLKTDNTGTRTIGQASTTINLNINSPYIGSHFASTDVRAFKGFDAKVTP